PLLHEAARLVSQWCLYRRAREQREVGQFMATFLAPGLPAEKGEDPLMWCPVTARLESPSLVAADVSRLNFLRKDKVVQSRLTSAATSLTGANAARRATSL